MDREEPGGPGPGEDELHAFVDGELLADRRRALVDRLAACPEAAGRVEAFARQRAALAALGRLPLERPAGDRLTRLERELVLALRRQGRVRRPAVVGAAMLVLARVLALADRLVLTGQGCSVL